jgi:hypothetical protein
MQEPGLSSTPPAAAAAAEPGRRRRPDPRLLHVLNGDTTAERLRAAGVPGQFTLSADVLYEGPVTRGGTPERRRRERARFLAESGYGDYDECLARLTRWDHALEDFRGYDEVVLWFEHDLFDQLHLCRLLAWFAGRDAGLTDLSLIQAGDYLGRMPPQQFGGLFDNRQPVAAAQMRLAGAAWDAFCGPDPCCIEALLATDTSCLPYLADAFCRHLEEFPATGDGLSRSERQVLAALASGPCSSADLFAATQRMEERVFMTDLSLLRRLRDMAGASRPLLRREPQLGGAPTLQGEAAALDRNRQHSRQVAITADGLAVLAGRTDWIEIRGGIDQWLGGVHLEGRDAAWRWDRTAARLAPGAPASSP